MTTLICTKPMQIPNLCRNLFGSKAEKDLEYLIKKGVGVKGEVQWWDRGRSRLKSKLHFYTKTTRIYGLYFMLKKNHLSKMDAERVEI